MKVQKIRYPKIFASTKIFEKSFLKNKLSLNVIWLLIKKKKEFCEDKSFFLQRSKRYN